MNLRTYQHDLVSQISQKLKSGLRKLCIVAPTGSGKTQIFCYLAGKIAQNNKRVWIIVHRVELAFQTSRTLHSWGVDHGRIAAGFDYDGNLVQVVSIDTLLGRDISDYPDYLILDECDLCESKTWQAVIKKYGKAILLGFTATPQRLDGKGLGNTFQEIVMGPSVKFLMQNNYLATPIYYGVANSLDLSKFKKTCGDYDKKQLAEIAESSPVLTGDIVEHYSRICPGSRFVGFATSIKHAEKLSELFNKAGYKTAVIHSKSKDRIQLTNMLKTGMLTGLWTVDIFGRGVDVPAIETGILARPTQSLALHLQQLGRPLRPAENKQVRILDHAGNIHRHGFAETERQWSLQGIHKKTRVKEMLDAIRQCNSCWGWFAPVLANPVCPQCGVLAPTKQRATKEQEGELKKLTPEEVEAELVLSKAAIAERKACKTFAELQAYGKRTGKKPGWAFHVWRNR